MKNAYKIIYVKDCECDADAKTGKLDSTMQGGAGKVSIDLRMFLGPVCRGCGEPWGWRGSHYYDVNATEKEQG